MFQTEGDLSSIFLLQITEEFIAPRAVAENPL